MEDDVHLLHLWCQERRQSAFSALVTRYAGIVFGTALRRLKGNRALAEEATQNVFVLMAAKADSLARHPSLGAWLHRAAMWQAATMERNESAHARKLNNLAGAMDEDSSLPDITSPVLLELDAALVRLAEPDRRMLLMRFFEERTFREIAKRTGLSEAAAQKRASRALQRLSVLLHSRGVTAGTAAVSAALPVLLSQPAPAAVVERLTSTVSSAAATLSKPSMVIQTLSLMAYGKKIPLTAAAILALLTAITGCFLLGRQQALAGARPPFGFDPGKAIVESSAAKFRTAPADRSSISNTARHRLSVHEAIANAARAFTFWGEGGSSTSTNAPILLRELLPGEFKEALGILPEFKLRPDAWETAVWFVFTSIATDDPAQAASLIDNDTFLKDGHLPQAAVQMIVMNWAERDLKAAMAWVRSLDERGRGVGAKTWGELMARQIQSDPVAALSVVNSWRGRESSVEWVFRCALQDVSSRDALVSALNDAGDQHWLTIAATAPDDPVWLADHFVPWLFSRNWGSAADGANLCERIINRGGNSSARLAAVCQSLGMISSPELARSLTDELLPILKNLPGEKRQPFLDRITVAELKNRLMANF
jgi:RNA polymerase sigma-70 factor (ECF subfamily)